MTTGERLRDLRMTHDYPQRYVAYKLGISQRTYSDYERERVCPCTDRLIALAQLYDLSLDEITGLRAFESSASAPDIPA